MKHSLVALALFFVCIPTLGEGWSEEKMSKEMDKAIAKALKAGTTDRFTYCQFVKQKVGWKFLHEYFNKQGYYVVEVLGNVWTHENEYYFEIVPYDKAALWVIKGTFFPKEKMPDVKKGNVELLGRRTYHDIFWTGDVVNGNIDGKGYGGAYISKDSILLIDGTFRNGKMAGEVTYRIGKPEETGYLRIAGSLNRRMKDNALCDYGWYANVQDCGEGVAILERAFYVWDEKRETPKKYTRRGPYSTGEGSYWYYVDKDLKEPFQLPVGTFRHEADFKDGYALVKHCPTNQWDARKKNANWIEYKVDHNGHFTITDNEKTIMVQKYNYVMEQWDEMMREFKQGFPDVCDAGFLPGMNVPERITKFDEYYRSIKLVNPEQEYSNMGIDINKYITYRQLVELFDIAYSNHHDEWELEDNISDAIRSYQYTDYRYRPSFKVGKYFYSDWMTIRERRGKELISVLESNKKFNPPGKSASLNRIRNTISKLSSEYRAKIDLAYDKVWQAAGITDTKARKSGEQIDWYNSVSPSDLEKRQDLFFNTYYTYKKEGVISFKDTYAEVRYNIVYHSDKTLDYYVINYSSLKDNSEGSYFKSEADMIKAIIRMYNKTYPK